MGNIIKSMNLDLILEGTGVKPTIPTNPRAVFGNPDFDQTSDLMIGQKAYNVTDDIWYYRGKKGIYEIPTNKTYVIDVSPYIGTTGITINKPGNYYIYQSQYTEGGSVFIVVNLNSEGYKVSITNTASVSIMIGGTDSIGISASPGYTYNFITIKKSIWPFPLPELPPDIDYNIEYITTSNGFMQLPTMSGGETPLPGEIPLPG